MKPNNLRVLQAKKAKEATSEEMIRLYNVERFKVEVSVGIAEIMENDGVPRLELADTLGKHKSSITEILNGHHNYTLETLADVFWALGWAVHLTLSRAFGELRVPIREEDEIATLTLSADFATDHFANQLYRTRTETLPACSIWLSA